PTIYVLVACSPWEQPVLVPASACGGHEQHAVYATSVQPRSRRSQDEAALGQDEPRISGAEEEEEEEERERERERERENIGGILYWPNRNCCAALVSLSGCTWRARTTQLGGLSGCI
ncbi:unnamed protein product, partial [Prorocentrum cordatum]